MVHGGYMYCCHFVFGLFELGVCSFGARVNSTGVGVLFCSNVLERNILVLHTCAVAGTISLQLKGTCVILLLFYFFHLNVTNVITVGRRE